MAVLRFSLFKKKGNHVRIKSQERKGKSDAEIATICFSDVIWVYELGLVPLAKLG